MVVFSEKKCQFVPVFGIPPSFLDKIPAHLALANQPVNGRDFLEIFCRDEKFAPHILTNLHLCLIVMQFTVAFRFFISVRNYFNA